jgi:hypothetical protein
VREVEGQVLRPRLPDLIEEGLVQRNRDLGRHVDDSLRNYQTELEKSKMIMKLMDLAGIKKYMIMKLSDRAEIIKR